MKTSYTELRPMGLVAAHWDSPTQFSKEVIDHCTSISPLYNATIYIIDVVVHIATHVKCAKNA